MAKSSGYNEQGVGYSGQTTSKEAASTLKPEAARLSVLRALRVVDMADFEIHEFLKWPPNRRVTPRRRELVRLGLVTKSHKRAINPESGKSCVVWRHARNWEVDTLKAIEEAVTREQHMCPQCGCIY